MIVQVDWKKSAVRDNRAVRKSDEILYKGVSILRKQLFRHWPEKVGTKMAAVSVTQPQGRTKGAGGARDFDWEAALIEAAGFICDKKPKTLAKVHDHISTWFGKNGPGDTQIKKHIGPLFNRLTGR